jgi:zinc transport system ATP-binding protein
MTMGTVEKPAIQINHLSYHYDDRQALEEINLNVPRSSFLGLVGPNGSGKSTLIKCVLGLLTPQQGQVLLFGTPVKSFKKWDQLGYVSQKANSFNTGFPATVFEVVSMGLFGKIGMFRFFAKKHKAKVHDAIDTVGMSEYTHQNIGNLSGGQQQRVFIARALVSDPELLILDEPTVGIDSKSVKNFYSLLGYLNKEKGITLLLITHDIGTITDRVTHIACLNKTLHFHGDTKHYEDSQQEIVSSLYGHGVHSLEHRH